MHPDPEHASEVAGPAGVQLPEGFADDRNSMRALIADDLALAELYGDGAFVLEMGGELVPLVSPLLRERSTWFSLAPGDRIVVHVRRSLFAANCPDVAYNALFLQMQRDTPVIDGDEQRTKQTPVFSYQLFANDLKDSARLGTDYLMADISGIIELHRDHYHVGVLNSLLFCTLGLRDYHYQKQQNNAYYHIQAINLPFPNLEFHYLAQRTEGIDAAI